MFAFASAGTATNDERPASADCSNSGARTRTLVSGTRNRRLTSWTTPEGGAKDSGLEWELRLVEQLAEIRVRVPQRVLRSRDVGAVREQFTRMAKVL